MFCVDAQLLCVCFQLRGMEALVVCLSHWFYLCHTDCVSAGTDCLCHTNCVSVALIVSLIRGLSLAHWISITQCVSLRHCMCLSHCLCLCHTACASVTRIVTLPAGIVTEARIWHISLKFAPTGSCHRKVIGISLPFFILKLSFNLWFWKCDMNYRVWEDFGTVRLQSQVPKLIV